MAINARSIIAWCLPIPPHNGVNIAFGNGAYTGSAISAVHLREIRNSLDSLGVIVCGGWLNLASDKSKNHATRIRFTSEFRSLVEEYGLTLPDLHPRMLFNEEGLELDRDPYSVPGFDVPKAAAKETFNRLLNSRKKITYRTNEDSKWFDGKDAFNAYRDAMMSHLHPIAHLFQSDHGARLQKRDSELAINILRRCMISGIPIYPVHDSFIVPKEKEETVKLIMQEEYRIMFGFDCDVSS